MDFSFAPLICLALTCIGSPLLDLMVTKKEWTAYLNIAGIMGAIIFFCAIGWGKREYLGGLYVVDTFSIFFSLLFLIMALLVALSSLSYVKEAIMRYYVLLTLATLGMVIVASTEDLVVLYIALELASNSTYVLSGFAKHDKLSIEASMKYFLVGTFSSAILIFGISFIYGTTLHTNFIKIAQTFSPTPLGMLGIILVVAGLGFKVASVPFHMWVPDTYEGAPTNVTAFLAAVSKKAGFAALMRLLMVALFAAKLQWTSLFVILSLLTMTWGNVVALSQKSVKRMLAYSSIAHAGYIMIALALGTPYGITAGLFHILAHAFMTAGAFFVVALAGYTYNISTIEEYASFSRRAPLPAFAMAIFLLSLAGIPPLAGFFGKFYLFIAAIEGGLAWLAVIAVLNSALSLYYYVRVIKYMYLSPEKPLERGEKENRGMMCAILFSLAATILLGLFPQPIVDFLRMAVAGLP
jgi:proton-translocating NADH-quinone oxidoreductase chain N